MRKDSKLALAVGGVMASLGGANAWAGFVSGQDIGLLLLLAAMLAFLYASWNQRRNILKLSPIANENVTADTGALLQIQNIGRDKVSDCRVRIVEVIEESQDEWKTRTDLPLPIELSWLSGNQTANLAPQDHAEVVVITRTVLRPQIGGISLRDVQAHLIRIKVTADGNPPFTKLFRFSLKYRHPRSPWYWVEARRPTSHTVRPGNRESWEKYGRSFRKREH